MNEIIGNFQDVVTYYDNRYNPTLESPFSPFVLQFASTRESTMDTETYRAFLHSAMKRFRRSRTYKNYKGYLIGLGLNTCQVHGNIDNDMATIEMHHVISLEILSIIITEHMFNTVGSLTTFDLCQILKEEHKANNIAIVMLSLTPHQLFHAYPDFFIHPNMVFGNWGAFLQKYQYGITREIGVNLLNYVNTALSRPDSDDNGLLNLRNKIKDWSGI